MHWHAIWDWLLNQGLWKALESWAVFAGMTGLVGWRPWKNHQKTQEQIADRLDTSTPGGLADVMDELKKVDADEADR